MNLLVLLIIVILLFGGIGGAGLGHWNYYQGGGVSIFGILVVLLICRVLGLI